MHLRWLLLCLIPLCAACQGTDCDIACPAQSLEIAVRDSATGLSVGATVQPQFLDGPTADAPTFRSACSSPDGGASAADAGALDCGLWSYAICLGSEGQGCLVPGVHQITVQASGYQSAAFAATVTATSGACTCSAVAVTPNASVEASLDPITPAELATVTLTKN